MKNPIGRPTKYNQEVQDQADRYIYEWSDIGDTVPSRVGLCCFIGIHKDTSYEWEKRYPAFSDTCKVVDALQEHTALNKGISGVFNAQIVKLILANHGYSDKVQTDVVSSDGSMSPKGRSLDDFYAEAGDSD